jgi:CheY-like chemotaxis protein
MLRQRVLVVSGTTQTATRLCDMLEVEGVIVDAVIDGATAFQLVWETDYDAIVAELGMPGIDGRDLYMAFQNTWPELTRRMVFVTVDTPEEVEAFMARTSVPVLRGAVTQMELHEALRAVHAAPRSRAFA